MSTLLEVYQELVFLLPDKPTKQVELTILLVHAINLKDGMKNNGILEGDENKEWVGIAEGWQASVNGVYSLRYLNQSGETIQFKFVSQPDQEQWLQVNVIRLNDDKSIFSTKLDMSKLNFNHESELVKSNIIMQYKNDILKHVIKKQQQQPQQQRVQQQQPQGLLWQMERNNNIQGQMNPNFQYGRSDLDPFANQSGLVNRGPFGNNMGGNMMGPQAFGSLRQPQAPPGARFDPYSPDPNIMPFPNNFRSPFGGNQGGNNQFPPF